MKNLKHILRWTFIVFFTFTFFSCQREDNTDNTNPQQKENFITIEKATEIGNNLTFDIKSKNATSSTDKKISEISPVVDENNEPAFYVINYEKGGFAILAADDRSIPILSYSEDGFFDTNKENQPDGLIFWQSSIMKNIQYLRENNISQTAEVKYQWDHLSLMDVAGKEPPDNGCVNEFYQVGPLLTTTWNQTCGYNTYMPVLNCTPGLPCGHAYAGCVPIAIAQVMKYHQYPTSYSWSNMPNAYGTTTTASFIQDIHNVIPNISYSCSSTGVSSNYDTSALFRNSFGYSSAGQDNYNYQTVKQNLQINKPVILAGGGHMWVCEGFKNSKICMFDENGNPIGAVWYLTFRMNWGWGGTYNGWFSFNNFNPGNYNFNSDLKMVYNINP